MAKKSDTPENGASKRPDRKSETHAREMVKEQLTEGTDFTKIAAWYKKNSTKVTHIKCGNPKHNKVIAIEAVVPGYRNKLHPDGAQIVAINDQLLSYRVRLDGSIGYLCACGVDTLLLPEEAELRGMSGIPPHVAERIKDKIKRGHGAPQGQLGKLQARNYKEFKREKVK
jgi:hypothetical protein